MKPKKEITVAIKSIVGEMMKKVMERVLVTDPFVVEAHRSAKPLYAALVPDEIFKGSHFERRFVTPFGHVWERLALCVAQATHGHCDLEHTITGTVAKERLRRIQETLNKLEHSSKSETKQKPDWNKEIKYILAGNGAPVPTTVTCDLFIESKTTKKKYAFELKAPLPNSDQTKVSKEKLFKLLAMEQSPVDFVYYALPYNPYGKKQDYAWSFPMRWFDMKNDTSVLIGDEFWDLIGGAGTYQIFINEVNALGVEYKERIYREFLGVEPPKDGLKAVLK